jgi:hypothetical protein
VDISAATEFNEAERTHMEIDNETAWDVHEMLYQVSLRMTDSLNKSYGSYTKAPPDHPFIKAITAIGDVINMVPLRPL